MTSPSLMAPLGMGRLGSLMASICDEKEKRAVMIGTLAPARSPSLHFPPQSLLTSLSYQSLIV